MSGGLISTKNFSVKFDKVIRLTFVNGPNYIARENQFCFLQQEQISSLENQESYQEYLGNLTRKELLWWVENIRLTNGRKIQQ